MFQQKQENLNATTRREIAGLIPNKEELARIKTEQLIRDDYLIDALGILEIFCNLLLARFGLMEASRECDPSLKEAISTLIWAIPRLDAHIPELAEIRRGLIAHFGERFVKDAQTNQDGAVNQKIMCKLSIVQVNPSKVEEYLKVIADKYGVPYSPREPLSLDELTGGPLFSSKVPPNILPSEPYVGAPGQVANPLYSTPAAGPYPTPASYPPPGQQYPQPGQYQSSAVPQFPSVPTSYPAPGPYPPSQPSSYPYPAPGSQPGPQSFEPSYRPAIQPFDPMGPADRSHQGPESFPPSDHWSDTRGGPASRTGYSTYQSPHEPTSSSSADDGLLDLPDPPSSRTPGGHLDLPSVPGGSGRSDAPSEIPDFDDLARRFDALRNQQP